jgi:hypothetical protein
MKNFLNITVVEQETIEMRMKKPSIDLIQRYAKFRGCTMGEVVDAMAVLLPQKDKEFKAFLKTQIDFNLP